MRLAPTAPAHASMAPVEWFVLEERGPMTAHERYEHTVLEAWADRNGTALLTDGRMTYPGDPGTVEVAYESLPWLVRAGVDPDAAQAAARRGVALLATAVDAALPGLEAFRVVPGSRPSRDPEQLDLWIRTQAGDSARYLVPIAQAPTALLDARAAARSLAAQMRRDYDPQDGVDAQMGNATGRSPGITSP